MGASPSGTITLLFLVFIGPAIYAGSWAYAKFIETNDASSTNDEAEKEEGKREQLSSKQYLFALIGYAIGK